VDFLFSIGLIRVATLVFTNLLLATPENYLRNPHILGAILRNDDSGFPISILRFCHIVSASQPSQVLVRQLVSKFRACVLLSS